MLVGKVKDFILDCKICIFGLGVKTYRYSNGRSFVFREYYFRKIVLWFFCEGRNLIKIYCFLKIIILMNYLIVYIVKKYCVKLV